MYIKFVDNVLKSNNHTIINSKGKRDILVDICDELSGESEADEKGKYPKDFKFTGWHPFCRCYAVSILKTDEEIERDNERIMQGEEPSDESVNKVNKLPEGFTDWVKDNKKRIAAATKSGTLPYWVRDNAEYITVAMEEEREPVRLKANASKPDGSTSSPSNNDNNNDYQPTASLDNLIFRPAEEAGVMRIPFGELTEAGKMEKAIIERLATGDTTDGSCVPLALAYIGNKSGYNITDLRGGMSCTIFQNPKVVNTGFVEAAKGISVEGSTEVEAAKYALGIVGKGKTYLLRVGNHTAIIRRNSNNIDYLELQNVKRKGWHPLVYQGTVLDSVLMTRFNCEIESSFSPVADLINIEDIAKMPSFRRILEYVNTKK